MGASPGETPLKGPLLGLSHGEVREESGTGGSAHGRLRSPRCLVSLLGEPGGDCPEPAPQTHCAARTVSPPPAPCSGPGTHGVGGENLRLAIAVLILREGFPLREKPTRDPALREGWVFLWRFPGDREFDGNFSLGAVRQTLRGPAAGGRSGCEGDGKAASPFRRCRELLEARKLRSTTPRSRCCGQGSARAFSASRLIRARLNLCRAIGRTPRSRFLQWQHLCCREFH